jgi:hypothetical protein
MAPGRNRLVAVVIAVALGLGTTVGITWGCSLWSRIPRRGYRQASEFLNSESPIPWPWTAPPGWPEGCRSRNTTWSFGVRRSSAKSEPDVWPHHSQLVLVAGWPFYSLAAFELRASSPSAGDGFASSRWEQGCFPQDWMHARNDGPGRRMIPLVPIWSGLLANTAVFGALWLALGWGAARGLRLRRASRIGRGRCAQCGYDLAGSPATCPECGTAAGTLVP